MVREKTTTQSDRLDVVRIVVFGAVTPLALLVAPALTAQLIPEYGLQPDQAGVYFMFELGGLSLASLPALWWMKRFRARQVALVAALVFIFANLLSAIAMPLMWLYALRLLATLGGGTLMVLCLSLAAREPNSTRIFGLWVMGQLVIGAVGLAVFPRLLAVFGLRAFFVVLAAMMVAALPLVFGVRDLPQARRERGANPAHRLNWRPASIAMGSLLFYYVAIGGCWSFMTVIGQKAGIDLLQAADAIAIASLFGIAGAVAAAASGRRLARRLHLEGGFALLAVAMLLLVFYPQPGFLVAACVFKFAWTFALPPLLAVIGDQDEGGGIMAWSNLVIGTGNVIGPVTGG